MRRTLISCGNLDNLSGFQPINKLQKLRMILLGVMLLFVLGIASPLSHASISYVGSATGTTGTVIGTDLNIAVPAGVVLNDMMLAQVVIKGNSNTAPPSTPAGWTLQSTSYNDTTSATANLVQFLYSKLASGSEPASYDWTFSARYASGGIVVYRGVATAASINVSNVQTNPTAGTSDTAPTITPTVTNTMLVGFFAIANPTTFTGPASMTFAYTESAGVDTGTGGNTVLVMDEFRLAATATGTRVANILAGDDARSVGLLLALKPAADAVKPTIVNASAVCGSTTTIMVEFSERLDSTTAQTATNYTLTGGVSVTSAALQSNGTTVLLTTSSMAAATYTLSVSGVKDVALNIIVSPSTAAVTMNVGTRTSGIQGTYYDQNGTAGNYYAGTTVTRVDSNINFDWSNGIPVAGIPADNFTVRWSGFIKVPTSTRYVIRTNSDDGVRLYFNGLTLVDRWNDHAVLTDDSVTMTLVANQYYPVQMDYYEHAGFSVAQLDWSVAAAAQTAIPGAQFAYCAAPVSATPGSFNAYEHATAAGQIAGAVKTNIAGVAPVLDLIALNVAKTAIEPAFYGDVKVELLANNTLGVALGANNCPTSFTLLGGGFTTTFAASDAGRKANVTFPVEANSWRDVRVRLSYPAVSPTVIVCSSDNFAIRPNSLTVSASDSNWTTAGITRALNATGLVHKAAQPFTLIASAYNAAGTPAITTNYAGSATIKTLACTDPTPLCASATLSLGAWSVTSGVLTSTTASYPEVGSFNLTLEDQTFASVDNKAGDSSAAEYTIPQTAVSVGRFVPDHFDLSTNNTPQFKTFNTTNATCSSTRSITYIGQPFGYLTPPQALVTAKNASNATTLNYSQNLWKIVASGVTQTYSTTQTRNADVINTPTVTKTVGDVGTGTIDVNSTDTLAFTRTTPVAPFNAAVSLTMSATDSTDNVANQGIVTTTTSTVFNGSGSGIAFDSGNEFRFGRLRLINAHGSQLLNLPISMRAEYYNGTGFATNAADNCTTILQANILLANYLGGITSANMPATNVIVGSAFQQGVGSLRLNKPSPVPGSKGSVDVCVNLGPDTSPGPTCAGTSTSAAQTWLQGLWSNSLYDDDPVVKATFGVYRSGPVIYLRELY